MYSNAYLIHYIHLCKALQPEQLIWLPLICLLGVVIFTCIIIARSRSMAHHYSSFSYFVLALTAGIFFCGLIYSYGFGTTGDSSVAIVNHIPISVQPIRNAQQDLYINHDRQYRLADHERLQSIDNDKYRRSAKLQDDDLYRHQTTKHYYRAFMHQSHIIAQLHRTDEHGHSRKDSNAVLSYSGYHRLTKLHHFNTHLPYTRVGYWTLKNQTIKEEH